MEANDTYVGNKSLLPKDIYSISITNIFLKTMSDSPREDLCFECCGHLSYPHFLCFINLWFQNLNYHVFPCIM